MVRQTAITLSDGRELRYFDERTDGRREGSDTRGLDPAHAVSELRRDPLTDEWVVIAAHRQQRTHLPAGDACPLCPSTPRRQTEIPAPDYDVVVFENRFPSMSDAGRCEVICFSSRHELSFSQLPPDRVRTVIDAWAARTGELQALPGVRQVFPFENRGREIGVTLEHPHGQIYAYPFVTPRTARMLATAERYAAAHDGANLFADVLAEAVDDGARVVARTVHWVAFVPSAARYPVEVHVFPHRQVRSIPELTGAERDDLTRLYLDVLGRLDALYGRPMPYVAAWYQAPDHPLREHAWLHLQLFSNRRAPDKLKYLAGSEAAMDVFINDRVPEHTAAALRAAV